MAKNNMNTSVNTEVTTLEQIAPEPTKRDIPDDVLREDANTTKEAKKGEKKMANGKRVKKSVDENGKKVKVPVEDKVIEPFDLDEMLDAEVEAIEAERGEDFTEGAMKKQFYAIKDRLGFNGCVPIKSVEWVTAKIAGTDPEDDKVADADVKEPEIIRNLVITLMDESIQPISIRKMMGLYRNGTLIKNIRIYEERTYNNGTDGSFWALKEGAQYKDPDDIKRSDIVLYTLKSGSLWKGDEKVEGTYKVSSSTRKEVDALKNQLGLKTLKSTKGKFPIPEGTELNIFVYQDVVATEVTEEIVDPETNEVTSKEEKEEIKEFYRASFAAPSEHLTKNGRGQFVPKYNKAFTTSTDVAIMEENAQLPGVKAYENR